MFQIDEIVASLDPFFIHIETSIDLDLNTMPVVGRVAVAAGKFDALVRIVDPDVITIFA